MNIQALLIVLFSTVYVAKAQNCRAVEYNYYPTDTSAPIKSYWLYDSIGRLVKDSFPNKLFETQHWFYSQSFEYKGDSVIQSLEDGTTTIIKLTKNGLPLLERQPYGITYKVFYLKNGDLDRMERVLPTINEQGNLDSILLICDSIIYSNRDIVAFRVRSVYPKAIIPRYPKSSEFVVTCSYYNVEISSIDFYPVGKLTGLSTNPMGSFGGLNVSLFSKHLLKKMQSSTDAIEFSFQFDDKGKVIGIDRNFRYYIDTHPFNQTDHSIIKYDCKK